MPRDVPERRRRIAGARPRRRLARRRCWSRSRPAQTARSAAAIRTILVAELAGARARGDRQHRSRLPADQQVVQPVATAGTTSEVIAMLDVLEQIARTGIVREPAPDAGRRLARAATAAPGGHPRASLGRALCDPPRRRRLVQRLRARDPRARQSVLQHRGPGHPLRRQPAARRPAARHRPGVAQHGERAAPHVRCDAGPQARRRGRRLRLHAAASSARATRASAAWPT